MIIEKFDYKLLKSKFPNKFNYSTGDVSYRKTVIIRLTDSEGQEGFGEASPLPGFSTDTVHDIIEKLEELQTYVPRLEYEDNLYDNFLNLTCYDDMPSLRCAIEQAIFNLLLQKKSSFEEIINKPFSSHVPVNATIGFCDKEKFTGHVEKKISEGYKTIKLKVGRKNFTEDKYFIDTIINATGPDISIRLDPNGNWKYPKVLEYITQFDNSRIEYLEQPDSCLDELIVINKKCNIPIATDECIKNFDDMKFAVASGIKNFVIKPMLVGGLINSLKILQYAQSRKVNIIFSSCLESSIGFQIPAILAGVANNNVAHGLGIVTELNNSYFDENFQIENGYLIAKNINQPARYYDFDKQ